MPFPISLTYQSPRMSMLPKPSPTLKRDRPKGLWKARVAPRGPARSLQKRKPPVSESFHIDNKDNDTDNDDDNDDNDFDNASTSSASSKRHRRSFSVESLSDDQQVYYWDYSRKCSPYPDRVSSWDSSKKIMDTSSTAGPSSTPQNPSCDYEDWEDLKELFARAANQYENSEPVEALPMLRGVIHECHPFLLYYQDPSAIFLEPNSKILETASQIEESSTILLTSRAKTCKCMELPTAFHVILGTTLFLFGNLIAQAPSLALEGEPDNPVPYWLAALDVFETGENLPSRTSGLDYELPEDWRMAIVWGRTLVCIADEMLSRTLKAKETAETDPSEHCQFSALLVDEPDWPPESPFAAIVTRRPPITRRMSFSNASPNDLLVLAMDHFSRGIFHMPHPQQQRPQTYHPTPTASGSVTSVPPMQESFSRAKELFTIASEVLLVAEKLPVASERQQWASWADSVFNQMKMEADMDAWRAPINRSRGRCWLTVGSARIDEIEAAMEQGEIDLDNSEDAQEAREGLEMAISFFEKAKGSATVSSLSSSETQELQSLLAEALLTLGNLTTDEKKQEALYARAQLEGGEDYLMDADLDSDGDEIMTESF